MLQFDHNPDMIHNQLMYDNRMMKAKQEAEKIKKAQREAAMDQTMPTQSMIDAHREASGSDENVGYMDMLTPGHDQFHPTIITIMGQVNQALTGYGAVSVYGSQIFGLLGFGVSNSEFLTGGNFVSYFCLMTFAWLLIDAVGRRIVLLSGSAVLTLSLLSWVA